MSESDLELLKAYARGQAEDAFAEIVRRHLDLLYSAALRQVRSPQLAEEVVQSAFADLARNAHRLAPNTILAAWLYKITRRTAIDVIRREARRQARERIASEMNVMNATTADWTPIEPALDEAMDALDEIDRAAVLLRYFENKSLREVGQTLGTSEDAAQKRVQRALEHLRRFFAKRDIAVGVGGLAVAISANAVQAAPVALSIMVSSAAALAGTIIDASSAVVPTTKIITMTTIQKSLIGAAFAIAISSGIYEARQSSSLRKQVQKFQPRLTSLAEENKRITSDWDEARIQLAALRNDNQRLNSNLSELSKLRGDVTQLRHQLAAQKLEAKKANQPGQREDKEGTQQDNSEGVQNLQSDSWADVGLLSPEGSVQTWLWAARAGNAQRWAEASGQSSNPTTGVGWQNEMLEVKSVDIKLPGSALTDETTVTVEYKLHSGTIEHGFFGLKRGDQEWVISSVSGFPIRLMATPVQQDVQTVKENRP